MPSEMGMVERAARILEPQAWAALGTGDTLAYKNRRTSSLRKARAVIKAMRKPTTAMLHRAGGDLSSDRFTGIGMARSAWSDMIDEALSDHKDVGGDAIARDE